MKIENLILNDKIQRALDDMGFEESTQIQQEAIPLIMDGKDIVGQSNTGTGKTAAYAIPILEKINEELRMPQALVLLPTRELAVQVANEVRKISKYMEGIKTVTVYGGADIRDQINKLKGGAQIIVGTPGRVIDLIDRRLIKLGQLKIAVLDEADEMLKMGFREDMEYILSKIDHPVQSLKMCIRDRSYSVIPCIVIGIFCHQFIINIVFNFGFNKFKTILRNIGMFF